MFPPPEHRRPTFASFDLENIRDSYRDKKLGRLAAKFKQPGKDLFDFNMHPVICERTGRSGNDPEVARLADSVWDVLPRSVKGTWMKGFQDL